MAWGKMIGVGICALALAGCEAARAPAVQAPAVVTAVVTSAPAQPAQPVAVRSAVPVPVPKSADPELALHYAARADGERMLGAIDTNTFDPALLRQRVAYATDEVPGTVVIDTASRFLYLVEPDGMATRYGVAIGKEGFGWTGEGVIARTARWPRWTPPAAMIARDPSLAKWSEGMPGGNDNPLGARALYIYFGDSDSGYRIHGTNAPNSIGRAASSGCFRMLNQDVVDLYGRVARGARVVVR